MITLCLCVICTCALAEDARLPEVAAFSGGLLTLESTNDQGFCIQMTYRGSDADVRRVADAYLPLLTESYGMTEIFTFEEVVSDTDLRYHKAYSAAAHPEIGTFTMNGGAGRVDGCQLYIDYSQVANNDRNYFSLTYSSGFTCVDAGDRLAIAPVSEVTPTSSVATDCALCGGDGLCDTCGGLGYLEKEAYGGGMVKTICEGENCADGKCSACGGAAVAAEFTAPQGVHTFKEPGIEAAVREELGKSEGEITYGELRTVTKLTLNKRISDISDLQYMTGLTNLFMFDMHNISDLSPLAGLVGLKSLTLRLDTIVDIECLSGLTNLTFLQISGTRIRSLSPLSGLTSLKILGLYFDEISDIKPLSGLKNLTRLDLGGINFKRIYGLEELTNLTELSLINGKISDISQLANLTNLQELSLSNNLIDDLTSLAGLKDLEKLDLGDNNIRDIHPLANLTNLQELSLNDNLISDITPLAGLINLTELDLEENRINDVSSLAGLTNLEKLILTKNKITEFSPLDGLGIETLQIGQQTTPTPKPTATPTPKPTATPRPYKAPIVGNDGLLVMSPEEYLGIDACDHLSQQDNWYAYQYSDRGYEWYGSGTSNPVDWYKVEDYVDALVNSGYYEILAYQDEGEDGDYYSLGYTGPGSVKRTHKGSGGAAKNGAIVIMNTLGNIKVYYSLDIITNDLEDTQYRLNKYIFGSDSNSSDNSSSGRGEWCSACGNSGKCSSCGGNGQVRKHVAGTTDYIYQDCLSCFGSRNCSSCGGDGWR